MEREHQKSLRESCENFLYEEAQLLDNNNVIEWHEQMITEDIEYRIPIRTTRERSADTEFSDDSFHMSDDWSSLKVRVERMQNDFAWSEDPPSRTRRYVTNSRVTATDQASNEVTVRNNILVYRLTMDRTEPDFIAGERRDVLREVDDGRRLAQRDIYLDQTVLATPSLSIIL